MRFEPDAAPILKAGKLIFLQGRMDRYQDRLGKEWSGRQLAEV